MKLSYILKIIFNHLNELSKQLKGIILQFLQGDDNIINIKFLIDMISEFFNIF